MSFTTAPKGSGSNRALPDLRPRKLSTVRTVLALCMREMQTTYGRSPGGYIWAVLEPVLALALFTLVISIGLRIREPAIGTNFPLFFATGFLSMYFFTSLNNKIARSLKFSNSLLNYPAVRWTDTIISRFIVNGTTYVMVFIIIMYGIITIFDLGIILDWGAISIGLALTFALGLSMGILNCFLREMFPIWDSFWSILTRPLILVSPVFYSYHDTPADWRWFYTYNPLVHTIGYIRKGFYPTYDASHVSWTYIVSLSLITGALGLIFLKRYHRDILNL